MTLTQLLEWHTQQASIAAGFIFHPDQLIVIRHEEAVSLLQNLQTPAGTTIAFAEAHPSP